MSEIPVNLRSERADDLRFAPLLRTYLQSLGEQLAELRAARAAGDRAALCTIAHQLRGSGGGYGYPQISAAGAAVEEPLRAAQDLASVDAEIARLEALLVAALAGGPPAT